jgi:hypothetical protein
MKASVFINCHPNFSLSLFDPTILHALELNVKTDDYSMMKGALPLNIVYRIYYKLMKTTLEPQALLESPKGHTLLLQCNTQNSTICIPKQICWDDIVLPNKWTLENLVPLPKVENNVTDLDYVTQAKDSTIGLNFQPYRKSCSRVSGSRVSTSYNEMINKPVSLPRYSLSQLETNLQGINKGRFIDTLFYSVASATSNNEMNNLLRNYTDINKIYNEINNPNSPTQSQMEDPQIMMITRGYEINKEKL